MLWFDTRDVHLRLIEEHGQCGRLYVIWQSNSLWIVDRLILTREEGVKKITP